MSPTDGRTDRRTDGRTDRQTDKVIPVYPPPTSMGGGIIILDIQLVPWTKIEPQTALTKQPQKKARRKNSNSLCWTLCKTWKRLKFRKRIIWWMIFEWGHNLRFCPSSNIIRQMMKNKCNGVIANYKITSPATKFPDFSLTLRKTGISLIFPDHGNPGQWCRCWKYLLAFCTHHAVLLASDVLDNASREMSRRHGQATTHLCKLKANWREVHHSSSSEMINDINITNNNNKKKQKPDITTQIPSNLSIVYARLPKPFAMKQRFRQDQSS